MIRLLLIRHVTMALALYSCALSAGDKCSLLGADGAVAVRERLGRVPEDLPFEDRLEYRYSDLPARHIKPAGWIREFLDRQRTGLTGHPEQSGFPFSTAMWAGEMNVRDREYADDGSDWEPYEQTAYSRLVYTVGSANPAPSCSR